MNDNKTNIFFRLSRALVLVPYALFFVVQVFFNYDIAQPIAGDVQHKTYHEISANHQKSAPSLADKSKERKTHFRLNKRFQPVSILSFNQPSVVRSIHYFRKDSMGDYVDPLTPSHYLSASTLRGPPTVV